MSRPSRRPRRIHAWDNVIVTHWSQTPEQTRLKTDPDWSQVNWPFGDDVADVMTSLDDAHFEVYLDKVGALVQQEASRMPSRRRQQFLRDQQDRLDSYRRSRAHRPTYASRGR
jgi:hypothetical protein